MVNTVVDTKKFGHWVLYYISQNRLFYFDSFAMTPKDYGFDIESFYKSYPYDKIIVFNNQIQNDKSNVCGAYTIISSYLMCKNYSLRRIKSLFTKNTRRNDSYTTSFLYSLVGITLKCNRSFCPKAMFLGKCRKFCEC